MSYIGRQLNNLSDRVKLDSITASATATYNLLLNTIAYVPSSAESLTVSLNGVIQAPQDSYTVSGSTITFASTLSASDSIDFILAERSITLQTPSSGSVNTEQLASGSVTAPKLSSTAVDNTNTNSTLITAQTEKTTLVDADKFLISDSAASGALKYVQKSNLGAGGLVKLGSSSVGASTVTDITFDSIFSSTYESYRLIGFVNADTAGSQTLFRLRASGSDVGASSQYTRVERYTYRDPSDGSSGQESITGHTSNEWMIAGGGMRTDSDSAPCWFDLTFFTNTSRQFFNGTASYVKNTNTQVHTGYVGGITNSNLSPDGIKIFLWSGNIRYAEVSIFGVVQ